MIRIATEVSHRQSHYFLSKGATNAMGVTVSFFFAVLTIHMSNLPHAVNKPKLSLFLSFSSLHLVSTLFLARSDSRFLRVQRRLFNLNKRLHATWLVCLYNLENQLTFFHCSPTFLAFHLLRNLVSIRNGKYIRK